MPLRWGDGEVEGQLVDGEEWSFWVSPFDDGRCFFSVLSWRDQHGDGHSPRFDRRTVTRAGEYSTQLH